MTYYSYFSNFGKHFFSDFISNLNDFKIFSLKTPVSQPIFCWYSSPQKALENNLNAHASAFAPPASCKHDKKNLPYKQELIVKKFILKNLRNFIKFTSLRFVKSNFHDGY